MTQGHCWFIAVIPKERSQTYQISYPQRAGGHQSLKYLAVQAELVHLHVLGYGIILPQIREMGTLKKERESSKITKSIFSPNPQLKDISDVSLNSGGNVTYGSPQ